MLKDVSYKRYYGVREIIFVTCRYYRKINRCISLGHMSNLMPSKVFSYVNILIKGQGIMTSSIFNTRTMIDFSRLYGKG